MLMYWKNRAVNGVWKLQRRVYEVLRNEDGVGTVEIVLLILVATGLVLIFKDRITELVTNIFGKITWYLNPHCGFFSFNSIIPYFLIIDLTSNFKSL